MADPLPFVDLTDPIDATLSARRALSIIARVLQQSGSATTAIGGSVLFVIGASEDAAHKMESWRVDLDFPGGHWFQSPLPADVTVVASRSAFPAIINAPGEVQRLYRAGAFKVLGDRQRLVKLATLLDSAGNAISVRFPGML